MSKGMISQTRGPQILLSITGLKWFGIFIEYTLVHMEIERTSAICSSGRHGRLSNSARSRICFCPCWLQQASYSWLKWRGLFCSSLFFQIFDILFVLKLTKMAHIHKKRWCYALALGSVLLNQVLLFLINRSENTLGENAEDEIYIFWSYHGTRHPLTLQTASNSLAVAREDKHWRTWLFNLLTKARCWQESWIPDPVLMGVCCNMYQKC